MSFMCNSVRMSWYLIEVDAGQTFGGAANGKRVHIIIHSIDLKEKESSNMYNDRTIRFTQNRTVLDGKVVLAADTRMAVDKHAKMLAEKDNIQLMPDHCKRYLVQYGEGQRNVEHAVVHEKEITWPEGDLPEHPVKVLVNQKEATLLYSHLQDEVLEAELWKLKDCLEATLDEANTQTELHVGPWVLVQYSRGPTNVGYTIFNINDSIWKEHNNYKGVVAFATDNDEIFNVVILRKSGNFNIIFQELRRIERFSEMVEFPITAANDQTETIYYPAELDASKLIRALEKLHRKADSLGNIHNFAELEAQIVKDHLALISG